MHQILFLQQNTSIIVFIVYQVSVAAFFVVAAMNIDIFEQILAKIYFKMHQIPQFFPGEHAPVPL